MNYPHSGFASTASRFEELPILRASLLQRTAASRGYGSCADNFLRLDCNKTWPGALLPLRQLFGDGRVIVSADLEEFSEFAAARGTQLFRMAYLLAGDRHAAEDLTQTTLGKLYAAWSKVSRADNPVAYSRTVMVRTYVASQRKTRWERATAEVPDPGRYGEDTALRLTLFAALAELSGRDRAIVVLRYWEDHSVEDTATMLGVSSGTVRTRSQRALLKLRARLGTEISELTGR